MGTEAFVLYDLEPDRGEPFRNIEFLPGDDRKIKSVEVYFGSKIGRVEDLKQGQIFYTEFDSGRRKRGLVKISCRHAVGSRRFRDHSRHSL